MFNDKLAIAVHIQVLKRQIDTIWNIYSNRSGTNGRTGNRVTSVINAESSGDAAGISIPDFVIADIDISSKPWR